MKVALIGFSGRVGSRLLSELQRRGHQVTGIARHPAAQPTLGLSVLTADATDPGSLATALVGHDAVISASRFVTSSARALIAAVKQSGVPRLLVVGGAGSLEIAPGQALVDSPGFPDAFMAEACAGRMFLGELRAEGELDWTFLSPSAEFAPGLRTGLFRLGQDQLLQDANGKSHISMEDFAVALVGELEQPRHSRQRFTVGY